MPNKRLAYYRHAKYYLDKLHTISERYNESYDYKQVASEFENEWAQIEQGHKVIAGHVREGKFTNETVELSILFCFAGGELTHLRQDSHQKIEWLDVANKCLQYNSNPELAVRLLSEYGITHYKSQDFQRSIQYFEQARKLALNIEKPELLEPILDNFGNALAEIEKYEHAIELHKQALNIAQKQSNRYSEGGILANLGRDYSKSGKFSQGICYYLQALEIVRETGRLTHECTILDDIGTIYQVQQNYVTALDYHQQAANKAYIVGDMQEYINALTNQIRDYTELQLYDKALECIETTFLISNDLSENTFKSRLYRQTARTLLSLYQNLDSYDIYFSILINNDLNIDLEFLCLSILGLARTFLQHNSPDIENYKVCSQLALYVAQKISTSLSTIFLLETIAQDYQQLGKHLEAIQHYSKAVNIAEQIEAKDILCRLCANIGNLHSQQSQFSEAREFYRQALTTARGINDKHLVAVILGNMGIVYAQLNDKLNAMESFSEARRLFLELNLANDLAVIEQNMRIMLSKDDFAN